MTKQKKDPFEGRVVVPDTDAEAKGITGETFFVGSQEPLVSAPGHLPLRKGNLVYVTAIRSRNNPWHGVYLLEPAARGNKWKIETVCEVPFRVDALVSEIDSGEQAIEFSFLPAGGNEWLSMIFDKAALVTGKLDSNTWKRLTRLGLNVSPRQLVRLQGFIRFASDVLAAEGVIPKKEGTKRTGWVGGEYVAPGFRTPGAPVYIGRADDSYGWEQAGDKTAYLSLFKTLVEQNPMFHFIAGYYLSGNMISRFGGGENGILCLLGDSTLGKTLAARFALSMKGRPAALATFNATPGALTSLMAQHNDACLVIDEVGTTTMGEESRARFVYDVAAGIDRARLQREGGEFNAKAPRPYHYAVLMTGEESLLSKPSADGQRVRYTEIVFSRDRRPVWRSIASGEQADRYLEFFSHNHGWIMPLAIQKLRDGIDRYRGIYAAGLSELNAGEAGAKANRKHKLLAGAMAGMALLDDVLGCEWQFDKGLELATEIATAADREMEEAGEQGDQFWAALTGTLVHYRQNLYVAEDGLESIPNRFPVIGSYVVEASTANIDRKVHTFVLDKTQAARWADQAGIDLARFLDWAEESGVLRTYDRKGQGRPRRDNRLKIGNAQFYAYKFIFEM